MLRFPQQGSISCLIKELCATGTEVLFEINQTDILMLAVQTLIYNFFYADLNTSNR